MFRNRRRQESLPTSSNVAPSYFHLPSGNNPQNGPVADGSGKAIHMEAPIARAWKKASTYTKGSYYAILFCIFLIYFGYRWLRWSHASVHLVCHTEECTFTVTPRGWKGSHKVQFPRHQLIKAEAMKVTNDGTFVALSPRLDDFNDPPVKGKKKKKTTSYKGPDQLGHFPSYRIFLRESTNKSNPQQGNNEQTGDSVDGSEGGRWFEDDVSLSAIAPHMDKAGGDEWTITLRKFGIYQSRRRVKTTVQKIDSYIKRRRHKLTVKENTPPAWQGILMLVLGIFGLLLSILVGQFWDEEPTRKRQAGPGARNRSTPDYKGKRPTIGASSAGNRRKAY